MKRHDVLNRHAERMKARQTLLGEIADAKQRLSPTLLWKHWKRQQIDQWTDRKDNVMHFAKNNAVIIGGAFSLGAFIAAGWQRITPQRKEKRHVTKINIDRTHL